MAMQKAAGWYKDGDQTNGTAVTAANLVKDGSKATVDGKEYAAMNDADGDGVDDDDSSITKTSVYIRFKNIIKKGI